MAPTYGPRPENEHRPEVIAADTLAAACMRVSRTADGRTFACARPQGHAGEHYGAQRDGRMVRLGFGR